MSPFERFEDIDAWQEARKLVNEIYAASREGRLSRDFALRDQLRRAAISVMSNIAEGFERDGDREFIQFLSQAKGSCGEVQSQLYVARDQGYISEEQFHALDQRSRSIGRLLGGLMKYLRTSTLRGPKFK